MEQARKALAQGETGAAEKLVPPGLGERAQSRQRRHRQAAEAAYQLGVLAESRIDYGQADQYYRQAVQLQPDNPGYLNAAGNAELIP